MFGTDPIRELDLPLFGILTVPGKGKGLVARFNIAKGTRILYENPFLPLHTCRQLAKWKVTLQRS